MVAAASSTTGTSASTRAGGMYGRVAETLTAVTLIMDTIRENGYTVSTMGEAAKRFIANWESEKYRKSLAEKA